ncbi:hypothetical protein L1987_45767 [Smallanthus sonchifolius]|uniref:Uncharacterized protein n=1 Tax=Smallanthus sonchifolius TaxID=185202 RepID=A0ACB9FZK8_9ASTR|nr:hypothetical protein L1987_45767 [Smallanthus sonchifolius]
MATTDCKLEDVDINEKLLGSLPSVWYVSAQLIKKTSNLSELSLDGLIAILQSDEIDMIKSSILKYEKKVSGGCA